MQARLEQTPDAMRIPRSTVDHPYATIKVWMGSTHFLTKRLEHVKIEMSLHVLAYNFSRLLTLLGMQGMLAALKAYARFLPRTGLFGAFLLPVLPRTGKRVGQGYGASIGFWIGREPYNSAYGSS